MYLLHLNKPVCSGNKTITLVVMFYVLPVEIKNYKGANAELSSDRKTISFTSGLTDMFDKPAVLEYEVTF